MNDFYDDVYSDDDHNPKYNIDSETLDEMNEKMANISGRKKEPPEAESGAETTETVERGGVLFHKRTNEDYKNIWEYFVTRVLPEFSEHMGYGISEIEEIGINEFIDAWDWSKPEDTWSFKDDMLHVVPCAHCGKHFCIFEATDIESPYGSFGLCQACQEKYDMPKLRSVLFETAMTATGGVHTKATPAMYALTAANFYYDPEIRQMFLKKEGDPSE